jgi:hypothetical protein
VRLKYWEAGLLAKMREDRREKPSATVDVNVQLHLATTEHFFHAYGNQPLITEGNVMAIFKDKNANVRSPQYSLAPEVILETSVRRANLGCGAQKHCESCW